jgi:predicted TIM-barrel fold metal-dependent hydrolase
MRGHGRRKVLFGSNHPAWPARDCLEGLDALGLDAETTELFLHANAERVFDLRA